MRARLPCDLVREAVARVRPQRRVRHEDGPRRHGGIERVGRARRTGIGALEHAAAGRVPFEVVGIELHALDRCAACEAHDRPLVSRSAAALRLPAVAHVGGPAGLDEVLPVAVPHVTALGHESAVLHGCEVHDLARRQHGGIRDHVAVHAQSRDASVRMDRQAQVRDALGRGRDRKAVLRVAREHRAREQRRPRNRAVEQRVQRGHAVHGCGIHTRGLGKIAREEARIDGEAANAAGRPQANDRPVLARCPAPPRLPSIHPLTALGVRALAPLGTGGLEQPLLRREELIVSGEHSAAESLGGEVDQVGESRRAGRGGHEAGSSQVIALSATRRPARRVSRTRSVARRGASYREPRHAAPGQHTG